MCILLRLVNLMGCFGSTTTLALRAGALANAHGCLGSSTTFTLRADALANAQGFGRPQDSGLPPRSAPQDSGARSAVCRYAAG